MSAGIYANINGVTRKGKKLYAKVNGVVRPIKEAWVKVNGVSRRIYQATPKLINTEYKLINHFTNTDVTNTSSGSVYSAHFSANAQNSEFYAYPVFDKSFTITHVDFYAVLDLAKYYDSTGYRIVNTDFYLGSNTVYAAFDSDGSMKTTYYSKTQSKDINDYVYNANSKSMYFYIWDVDEHPKSSVSMDVRIWAYVTTKEYGTFRIPLFN